MYNDEKKMLLMQSYHYRGI